MRRLLPALLVLALASCRPSPASTGAALRLLASTSIIADVVQVVAGKAAVVQALLPAGVDPHSFQPSPRDLANLAEADLLFLNGLGLEDSMGALLQNAGSRQVMLSQNLQALSTSEEGEDELDPHVWLDPRNVELWVERILEELIQLDPANAAIYQTNAQAYRQSLAELDRWAQQQLAGIPIGNRQLVSQHQVLGYFAGRYGFAQAGAVLPGFSTLAQPSARDLAALQDAIQRLGVKAIFVESTINPSLAQRLAQDTGVAVVLLYTDSLSLPGGPASTYLEMMRYNITEIVKALR